MLLTLTFVYTLNFIDRALLAVLAQPIITEFGLTDTELGFLAGPPFALFYALMGIPIALAADRYNRVAIMAFCIALWSLMTALCGLATGFLFLLIARIGVAIGEAGSNPPSNSIIADYYRPSARSKALGIYSTGVMLGNALAFLLGGQLGQLPDDTVRMLLEFVALGHLPDTLGWGSNFGWRFAFIALGIPGVVVGIIVLVTIREPPRGYSDPERLSASARSSVLDTLRMLASSRSFWFMTIAVSLIAMVGYGHASFQAPMMQRLHDMPPGEFAVRFGLPLSVAGAVGTLAAGYLTERLVGRSVRWIALLPAISVALSVPLYIFAFHQSGDQLNIALICWVMAMLLHYVYLSAQYTIGQGVVPQHSRATAIAIMLFIIAIVGNGLGPQIVGLLSDSFMRWALEARGLGDQLEVAACNPKLAATLPLEQQRICAAIYGEGLRNSMTVMTLVLWPAAFCLWLCSKSLDRELLAR